MHPLPAEYVHYLTRIHEQHGNETDFFHLARALGIRVLPGSSNAYFPGPTPTITLFAGIYSGRLAHQIGMHEVAHHLLRQGGYEREILRLHGTWPDAEDTIERVARLGAAYLLVPETMVKDARRLHGDTAQAVLHLHKHSVAPLRTVLRRWVHNDETASRAAWLMTNRIVSDLAAQNMALPFTYYDQLPYVPRSANPTYTNLPGSNTRQIGVCWA
jgi:hypothetical protein